MDIASFKELPIMGILRGADESSIAPLTEAALSAGIKTLEITMNTPNAPALIRRMTKASKKRLMVGAGTVLDRTDLNSALDAGATFIVLPALIPDIVDYCVKKSVPVFPGALTPHEIYRAWQAKPAMVKVFPAAFFGPSYFKEIKGPFGNIELLACGGVTSDNIVSFFSSGASAVAFGGSVFKKDLIAKKQFGIIEKNMKSLVNAFMLTRKKEMQQ